MNTRAWQLWLEALRSGEYVKGTGALRIGDQFCCLGVACEVAVKEGVIAPGQKGADGVYTYDGIIAVLPDAVARWLGTPEGWGNNIPVSGTGSLCAITEVNDKTPATFAEIADILEEVARDE